MFILSVFCLPFISCEKDNDIKPIEESFDADMNLNDTLSIYLFNNDDYTTEWINEEQISIMELAVFHLDCHLPDKYGCWEVWHFRAINTGIDTLILQTKSLSDSSLDYSPLYFSVRVR